MDFTYDNNQQTIMGMSGYHYVPYYHADSEAQHAPKVDLN